MLKRTIPLFITGAAGGILILAYFSPATTNWGEVVTDWMNTLAAVAFILGGGNLLFVNLEKISSKRPGWAYALVTLLAFVVTLAFGVLKIGAVPNAQVPATPWAGDYESVRAPFGWVYEYVLSPLTATMIALLAFYVASAAFRAFRAKNIEAILLLGTAFVILLGRTAAAGILTGWISPEGPFAFLRLDTMAVNIMQYVSTAGTRAVMMGIALGIAATSLRLILGIDRSYLVND